MNNIALYFSRFFWLFYCIVAVFLYQFILELNISWDMTANARLSLNPQTQHILKQFNQPLTITAYAKDDQPLRQSIRDLLEPYQVENKQIKLIFINPTSQPSRSQIEAVQQDGELHLNYLGRTKVVRRRDKATLNQAFFKLLQSQKQVIYSLQGHGERHLLGMKNFDLQRWQQHLSKQGFVSQSLDLQRQQKIPKDANLLMIATPRIELSAFEIQQIMQYVAEGGAVLWLLDPSLAPDPLQGLQVLAQHLGLSQTTGRLIDNDSYRLFGQKHDSVITLSHYPKHSITASLKNTRVLLPEAAPLIVETSTWQAQALLKSSRNTWLETDDKVLKVKFTPLVDQHGPFTLGWSFERDHKQKIQRIVVLGDGDFLSNSYIDNAANLELGMQIIYWLLQDNHWLDAPQNVLPDKHLRFSSATQAGIGFVFLIFLPLLFLSIALRLLWKRRRVH